MQTPTRPAPPRPAAAFAAPELYEAPSHAASWPREHVDYEATMSQMTGCHGDQATMGPLALLSDAAPTPGEATGEAGSSGTTRETTNDDEYNNAGNNSNGNGNALKRVRDGTWSHYEELSNQACPSAGPPPSLTST